MDFVKMHGLGNDFVFIEDKTGQDKDYTVLARAMCNRHTGIGADGLIVIVDSRVADVRMRIINSDGSEAEMCGNGIRCISSRPIPSNRSVARSSPASSPHMPVHLPSA